VQVARKKTPPSTFRPSKETARLLVARGQALHAKRKYRAAIAALSEALRHWNRREIHFNIALCYFKLRDAVGAIRHLRAYLRGASQKERDAVPRSLRRLRGKVGVLIIDANDANAVIRINGTPRGKGRLEWVVPSGEVHVTINRAGASDLQRTVKAHAGGTTYWDVTVNRIRDVGPNIPVRRTRLHWRWFTIAASVAVAATGAALGLGFKTSALHADFDANPTWNTRDQGIRFQTLTNIMWGVTAAGAVTAALLAYFTRWKRHERPAARRLTPVLTPTSVALTGRF